MLRKYNFQPKNLYTDKVSFKIGENEKIWDPQKLTKKLALMDNTIIETKI